MKLSRKSGMTLAAAAAVLLVSGAVLAPSVASAAKDGQCHGVNACKGKGECKSASSACKGKNACKGKGWSKMSKANCDSAKGKFEEFKT